MQIIHIMYCCNYFYCCNLFRWLCIVVGAVVVNAVVFVGGVY